MKIISALVATLLATGSNILAIDESDTVEFGAFTLKQRVDPLTDLDNSFIWSLDLAYADNNSYIAWICMDGNLRIFISTPYELGKGRNIPVISRFDKLKASKVQQWFSSNAGSATFAPSVETNYLTEMAKKSSRVIFRISDKNDIGRITQFDMTGISDALKKLPCYSK